MSILVHISYHIQSGITFVLYFKLSMSSHRYVSKSYHSKIHIESELLWKFIQNPIISKQLISYGQLAMYHKLKNYCHVNDYRADN